MNATKGLLLAKYIYYTVHDILLLSLEVLDEVCKGPPVLNTQREWLSKYTKKADIAKMEDMTGYEYKVFIMWKTVTPAVQIEVLKGVIPTLEQLEVRLDEIQKVQNLPKGLSKTSKEKKVNIIAEEKKD
jgi:hypothetical protein